MAYSQCSRRFNNQAEVKASAKEFIAAKDKSWYEHGVFFLF